MTGDISDFRHHKDHGGAHARTGYTTDDVVVFALDGMTAIRIPNDEAEIRYFCELVEECGRNSRILGQVSRGGLGAA